MDTPSNDFGPKAPLFDIVHSLTAATGDGRRRAVRHNLVTINNGGLW